MAGLMEALFGADGIGGQPGLVGKAGNAVWQGTGELSEGAGLGETIAKSLGNIPHLLTDIAVKNPLEILKNPASVLNDRGEVSITRLLFPDFRRDVVKQQKQQAEVEDTINKAKVVNAYSDLLASVFGAPGAQGSEGVEQAVALGVPRDQAERAAAEDIGGDMQAQQAMQSAQAMGVPEGIPVEPKDLLGVWKTNQYADARAAAEVRASASEQRAQQDQAAQDLRPPEIRRYEDDLKDFNNRNASYGKDLLAAQDKAEAQAAKDWEAQQAADPANAGLLTIPPFTPEARAQARAQAAAEYEKAVPRPERPSSPFTPKKVDGVIKDAVPANTRQNLSVRKAIKDAARALTKSGMDPIAAKYAAAFMHTIENPQQAARILAPAEGETVDTVIAKIKAGVHVLKPGNEGMVMEALKLAGYPDEILVAAGDALDAQQAK